MVQKVGEVEVEVRAALGPYRQDMATAKSETDKFDRAAAAAMDRVEKSTAAMAAGAKAEIAKLIASQTELTKATQASAAASLAAAAAMDRLANSSAGAGAAAGKAAGQSRHARKQIQDLGAANKFTASELSNLTYQLNDVFVSLASGQNPMMVAIQQGSQLGQVLGMRQGGLAGSMKILTGFITPARVAVAGFGGALLLGAGAAISYQNALAGISGVASGAGRSLGMTGTQIDALAVRAAAASGQTVGAAREMAAALAGTGRIGEEVFGDLIAIQKSYARAMGIDTKDAAAELAKSFADPAKGAAMLNDRMGLLDATTTAYINTLVAQNRNTEAQRVLLDALKGSLDGASQGVGTLADQFGTLAGAASQASTWLGKTLNDAQTFITLGPQLYNQMKRMEEERARAGQARATINRASVAAGDVQRRVNPAAAGRQDLINQMSVVGQGIIAERALGNTAQVAALTQTYTQLQRAVTTYLPPAEKAHRLAQLDLQIAKAKTPAEKASLAAQRTRVQAAGEAVTATELSIRASDAAALAGQRAANGAAKHSDALGKEIASMEANTRGAWALSDAYLASEAGALKAEAARKGATRAARNGAEAAAQAARQLALDVAEQAVSGAKLYAQTIAQTEARKKANDQIAAGVLTSQEAEDQIRDEAALRPLIVAATVAEGMEKAKLLKIVEQLRRTQAEANREAQRAVVLAQIETQKDANAVLSKQIELVGKSANVRQTEVAVMQAEQEMRRQGIDLSSEEAKARLDAIRAGGAAQGGLNAAEYTQAAIDGLKAQAEAMRIEAGQYGKTRQEAEAFRIEQEYISDAQRQGIEVTAEQIASLHAMATGYSAASEAARALKEQQAGIAEAAGFFADSFGGAMESIIFDSTSAEDALRNLVKTLGRAAFQAFALGQGPLANFFGTAKPAVVGGSGGGFFSRILGGLFGQPGAAPTTAAVMHSGGIVGSASTSRSVNPSLFIGAPRFHKGLGPDEFPAILERGERVISKGGGRGGGTVINMTVKANDAGSFKRSERQVARQLKTRMR